MGRDRYREFVESGESTYQRAHTSRSMADSPSWSSLVVALLALLFVGSGAVGFVAASPQPSPVCPTCGVQFEQTASEYGYDLNVTRSEVDIAVHENGSAQWTTRTTLTEQSAQPLTESDARLIVGGAVEHHPVVDPGKPSVSLDGRTLRVTYTARDFATRRLGVLLVDAFHRYHTQWWIVNADRFTVHAPDGYRLASDAASNETAVTYEGNSQERFATGDSLDHDTLLAFTPEDTVMAETRADIAIAAFLLPQALGDLVRAAFLPALLLTVAVLLYPRLDAGRLVPATDPARLATITIGVTAIFVGAILASGLAWFGTDVDATLLAIGFGYLGTALAATKPPTRTTRGVTIGAIAGLLTYAASNTIVTLATMDSTLTSALSTSTFGVLLAIPAVALIPLGYADAAASRLARPLRVAIVAAPVVLLATRVPFTGGLGPFFIVAALSVFTLILVILGVIPYSVGVAIAGTRRE